MHGTWYIFLFCLALFQQLSGQMPAFTTSEILDADKTSDGTPVVRNQQNKYNVPLAAGASAHTLQFSLTRQLDYLNHPSGSAIFPQNGSLASQLDVFLACLEPLSDKDANRRFELGKDNYFCVYLTRLQITILYEIYQYLLSVYTNLLLTPAVTMQEYLAYEKQYGLNNKMLIVGHLMNIIEEQSNQAVLTRFPALPQYVATRMGPMLLRNDYGADLYSLLDAELVSGLTDTQDKDFYNKRRELYTIILSKYLTVFNAYTRTVEQPDEQFGTVCGRYARTIKEVIDLQKPKVPTAEQSKAVANAIRQTKNLNPPLFLYDDETIRALDIIPAIARNIGKNVQSVPWPTRVVNDAGQRTRIKDKSGAVISNQPRAYFLDSQGKETTSVQNAIQLFVNIPSIDTIYSQELKKQPEWLNTYEGVLDIVRACLGDYSALFTERTRMESILDPCSACIVMNAGIKAGILSSSFQAQCNACVSYIKQLRGAVTQTEQLPQLPTWTPELPPLPPPGL